MSGLLAVVGRDHERVDPAWLDRMLAAQAHRGPDRSHRWIDGHVALAYCQLLVTAEAALETQPHANEAGTVRIVLDGRLDNRDDLTSVLEARDRRLRDDTDAELLLRAYEEWGAACAAHLLGDFAFAVWDAPRRTLVCARDVLGIRPLYLHAREGRLLAASEIAPLLLHPAVSREPNDGYIAEHLTGQVTSRIETVWRDVVRLEPAHVLVASAGGVSISRYWDIDPAREIVYASDDEYADHLADLVRQSLRARLRRTVKVGVMLSGGIDSSSLVGALHEVEPAGSVAVPAFSTVQPGEVWDETEYMDAVAAKWPIRPVRVPPYAATRDHLTDSAVRFQDAAPYPNGEMANPLFAAAASEGAKVLLTGSCSDDWLTGSYYYCADLMRDLRLRDLWAHLRAQPDRPDVFHMPSLFRLLAWPHVPVPVKRLVKRVLGRDGIAPWVRRELATAVNLADRLRPPTPHLRFRTLAQADTYEMGFHGVTVRGLELHERSVSQFGIETRHPFGDRRIVEFGLAIPEEQRWRGRLTKVVLRNAARNWLPPLICERFTYGTADVVLLRTVEHLVSSGLWQNAEVVRRGWIEASALQRACDTMLSDHRSGQTRSEGLVTPLWLVCAIELWARAVLK